jgi:dipeptidyl-peptidase 4
MKKIRISAVLIFSLICLGAAGQEKQYLKLQDIWMGSELMPKFVTGIKSMKDGGHYTTSSAQKGQAFILRHAYETGAVKDTVFSSSWVPAELRDKLASFSGYEFSPDETRLLLSTEAEQIYRRSSRENYFVFDRISKNVRPLSTGGKQQDAVFSPDGKMIAFFRDNNLFITMLDSWKEIQITTDGKKNEIINGHADWVYEEEFEIEQAFFWSPDSRKLAYYRFDESKVKEFSMEYYKGDLYPEQYRYKYPKVGELNSEVGILIYNVSDSKTVKVDVGPVKDQYIPRIQWTTDPSVLSFQRMNRLQNRLEIVLARENGSAETIYTEESKTYIDISNDLTFLKNGKHFIFSSSKSGYNHLYLLGMDRSETMLTSGNWEVTKLYGVDEEKGLLYYQSAEESPLERYVYSVDMKGKKRQKLSSRKGTNDAAFSSGYRYFINTFSDSNTPFVFTLHDSRGREIKLIEDNSALRGKLKSYSFSPRRFFSFRTSAGVTLNGWMIKPENFDSTKKYPVYMFVYGGPGSQTVNNSWDPRNGLWYQLLAQKGYIVVSVDNRGTGSRGDEFRKCTYLNLGAFETEDQLEAARYLARQPYVDPGRIGIQGWSYGGYMASMCMTKGAGVFKAGIAVAPVTHWKFYDTIYTERYMQTQKENSKGYEESSPLKYADKLQGKFLMIHGTTDDNVHMQNSMEFVNALLKAGKQFDLFLYPNKNHGISGGNTRLHIYTKMTDFILENL